LINIPLWEAAKWRATLYGASDHPDAPPILALGFKNETPARHIFRDWLERMGKIDSEERIRVSIITGIDKKNPSSYKVVIGLNSDYALNHSKAKHVITVSRINQMNPTNSSNLERFMKAYSKYGKYILLPAPFVKKKGSIELFWELGIEKQSIRFLPAWQLSEHDPDVCALEEDDHPIIPADMKDAPVLLALQRLAQHSK